MFLFSIVIGFLMKLVGNNHHGCMYFTFEHNTDYQKIQKRFLEAVDSLDHNIILVSSQSKNIVLLAAVLFLLYITLPGILYHSSLRLLWMVRGRAAITAVLLSHKSGSTCFISLCFSGYQVFIYHV
jgi:hypothetical protein